MKPFKKEEFVGYTCGIAWDHEFGSCDVRIWPTKESLIHNHPWTDECGIVKVEVKFVKRIKKGKV